ncbi:tetratricopeptide repeat protein [Parasphingorhabdus sp.]|uniref:tetratricopeptide repeat protein n=1 Tax=Parasphingorhabdus sp. TaxID=2709688 RepID=UPI003A91A6EE
MFSSTAGERRTKLLRAEVHALLQSPDFVRSPVMSQLLRYLVEQAISNPEKPPKAYQIAVDGLGRTEDFDVQADSYPRVQVGRLRKMLAAHYAALGSEERLRIPIGHYAVEIQMDDGELENEPSSAEADIDRLSAIPPVDNGKNQWFNNRQTTIGLAAFLLFIGICLAWALNRDDKNSGLQDYRQPPKIYFSSSQEGFPDQELGDDLEIRMFFENAFSNSSQVRLAAAGISSAFPEQDQNAYRFEDKLVTSPDGREIIFTLTSLARNETIWSATIAMPDSPTDYPEKLGPIASRVASTYGAIATDQRRQLPAEAMTGYACLLRFGSYRLNHDPLLLPVVESCIEKSLAADPLDSQILSAASFMSFARQEATGKKPNPEEGLQYARRAMVRGREDSSSVFALARASFYNGSCTRGKEFALKAIELDPYEATIQAETGANLFACNDPDATKYLRRAIVLDPRGSIVAETGLVLTLLSEGKNKEALAYAEKIIPSSTGVGPYYDLAMAMVYAKNGRIPESRLSWKQLVSAYGSEKEESPEELLGRLITNPALADRAFQLLSTAGVFTE